MSMWLQAKQRAVELDSMVLWCDGGDGGVSGIGGGGFEEVTQIGSGSWVRTIGIQYPFNEKPTIYARFEDWTVLLYWLMAFGFTLDIPVRYPSISSDQQKLTRNIPASATPEAAADCSRR